MAKKRITCQCPSADAAAAGGGSIRAVLFVRLALHEHERKRERERAGKKGDAVSDGVEPRSFEIRGATLREDGGTRRAVVPCFPYWRGAALRLG